MVLLQHGGPSCVFHPYIKVFLVFSLAHNHSSGFPHHPAGLPDVELAIGSLQHVLQVPCKLWEHQRDLTQAPAGESFGDTKNLRDLRLYLSIDAGVFPEKDEAWSSEISQGLTSFLSPMNKSIKLIN